MQQYPMSQQPNNNNKKMVIVLVVLCVLAVIALIGLVWVVAGIGNGGSEDNKTNAPVDGRITVYNAVTGEEISILETNLDEYIKIGYSLEKPVSDEKDITRYGDAVVLYQPGDLTIEVPADSVQQYLDREGEDKYYTEPVMYIYHVSEEKKVVKTAEVGDYIKSSTESEDGTLVEIDPRERWYREPVVVMYAPKDRFVVINAGEEHVKQYEQAGWHKEPVAAVKKNGEEKVISVTELEKYIADGWTEFNPKAEPCSVCGTRDHVTEEHPRCALCNSTGHTTEKHPVCKYCNSKSHTTKNHTCTKCGGKGHDASACTSICAICGSTSHSKSGHPCTKCGGKGHDARECTVTCAICGLASHNKSGHPCTKCGGKGHDARECTVTCAICGSTSHNKSGHVCTRCGGKGHDVSTCTASPCDYCGTFAHASSAHPKCAKCGSVEHTVHPTCDYCDSTSHTSFGHPTCSWCGSKYHTPDEHDAAIAEGRP